MASSLEHSVLLLDDVDWLERRLLGKARKPPSILTDDGFIRSALKEARLLRRQMGKTISSRKVRDSLKANTNINWKTSTDGQKERALDALEALLAGLSSDALPKLTLILDEHGKVVTEATHVDTARKYRQVSVDASFALKNAKAIAAIRDTTSIFFVPEYEQRATRFRRRAQDILADGTAKGLGTREIGSNLRREFTETGIASSYWDTVAANHTNRARSFSAVATYAENGIDQYEVVAILDSRTSQICIMMNGTILSTGHALDSFDRFEAARDINEVRTKATPFMRFRDGKIVTATGALIATKTTGGWDKVKPSTMNQRGIDTPPYHHRCYPGDTQVQGKIVLCSRFLYSGEVVEVRTKGGRRLALTPNHPVLTPEGFVRADALENGDDLLGYCRVVNPSSIGSVNDLDEENEPITVKEVFRSLGERSGVLTIDGVSQDFHGDAIFGESKIEVVAPNRELLIGNVSELREFGRDPVLSPYVPTALLPGSRKGLRPSSDFVVHMDSAPGRPPGSRALTLDRCPPLSLDRPPLQSLCVGPASEIDAGLTEDPSHRCSGDAVLAGDLLRSHPGDVVVDQVVDIRWRPFSGHVYDLQTEGGWAAADQIIVSNCRTTIVPVFDS